MRRIGARCGGYLSTNGARHRYIALTIRGTGTRKCGSVESVVGGNKRIGTKSGLCTIYVGGAVTLFRVNAGPLARNVGVLKTRVSSPHVSMGRGPLCRGRRFTCLSARCCNKVGGCR